MKMRIVANPLSYQFYMVGTTGFEPAEQFAKSGS